MTAPTGRVRITYEANSITPNAGTDTRVAYTAVGAVLVPADAAVEVLEPIEDLRPGDVVQDRDGVWLYRTEKPQLVWRTFVGTENPDSYAARPFKLHIRDGVVLP